MLHILTEGLSLLLKMLILIPVRIYQYVIAPLLPKVCRYTPTCSHYMVQAVEEWGPLRGFWMGLRRIGRCHPWGGHGPDPVPPNPAKDRPSS